jgi:hypothetical protein
MTTEAKQKVSLDDVLSDMALTSVRPDAKVLADYVRRYPQFAEELVDFAAELAAEAISAAVDEDLEPPTTGTSPAVSKALSHLQNRLYEVRQEEAAHKASGQDLFGVLDREQFRSVATKVGVNTFFLTKVRDRTIAPDTIPRGFRLKVAKAMAIEEPILAAYLAGPPTIPDEMRFLSEQKPEASRQQSFVDAVKSSSLTDDQQRDLLAL